MQQETGVVTRPGSSSPLAPHWKPGALWVQLGEGTASTNTLNLVLPRGQDRVGGRRNSPAPSFLGFQEGALPQ